MEQIQSDPLRVRVLIHDITAYTDLLLVVLITHRRKLCKVTRHAPLPSDNDYALIRFSQFNIFYPDLIDKSKAPTYKIVKEPGNEDTVLLYFSAGPPYEDIAFRIVNREWEFSHKR